MNTDFIRAQFPGLREDYILMDNAGGSQIANQVISKVNEYFTTSFVQLGASYEPSRTATERVGSAQKAVQILLNAADENELVIGSSSTMLLRQLAQAMLKNINVGDEIIVTNCDHESNIGAWRSLERFGIVVRVWEINKHTLELDLEELGMLMNDRTALVAFTHASNVLGTINDVKKITSFIHERGALVCVDGVAYAPHRLVDVQDLDTVFYVYSFYKTYGPHQAVLYGKKELLIKLDKLNHYFIPDDEIPYKLQPGNVNHELTFGLTGILDYFLALAENHECGDKKPRVALTNIFQKISNHEEALAGRLMDFLNSKANVRIVGSTEFSQTTRVPTISFVVAERNSREITLETDKHNIGIRYGDFYARQLIESLELQESEGVVRVSMVHYNTIEQVETLIKVLDGII